MLALAAFLLLALVGVLVDAYYQSDRIYGELEVVLPSLRQASDSLAKGQLPSGDPFLTADRAVRRAADAVDHARFTFNLAGAIPLFGRPVHAIRHGVAAVGEVRRAAVISRRAVEDLLGDAAREPGSVRAADTPLYEGGVVNLKLLRGLTPRLDEVIAHLRAADREIRAIPSVPYLPNVARVRDRAIIDAGRAIRLSQRALSGAKLLPGFLGEGGSKTYFVALQNNADLRGPGGGVTAYAILVAKDGRLRIVQGGDIRGFRVGSGSSQILVSLPEELRWYVKNVPHAFTRINGVNYTPNFPLVAEAWARMASKVTGRRFDGVIEMDQFAIARLLGTSKVRVPAYPRPITGRNLVRVVSHDQYLLPVERQLEFPAQLIAAAWPKMLDPRSPQDFLASLGQLLREKRIQLWSAAPDLQEWLRRLGWDGGVRVGEGDYLYVVDNKVVPNKVDYYGRLAVNYDVTIDTSGDAHAKLEVTLTNGSPPGLPVFIAGPPGKVGGYAVNKALLLAYVPERVQLAAAAPETGLPDHIEAKAKVFARTISAPAGGTAIMRLEYTIPDVVVSSAHGRLYRLTVQHQPLIAPVHLNVTITLPKGTAPHAALPGWTVRGNVLRLEIDLVHDMVHEIAF